MILSATGESQLTTCATSSGTLQVGGDRPAALHPAYRDRDGLVEVQTLQADEHDIDIDRWVPLAAFVGNDAVGWKAYPRPALKEMTGDQGRAQSERQVSDSWA